MITEHAVRAAPNKTKGIPDGSGLTASGRWNKDKVIDKVLDKVIDKILNKRRVIDKILDKVIMTRRRSRRKQGQGHRQDREQDGRSRSLGVIHKIMNKIMNKMNKMKGDFFFGPPAALEMFAANSDDVAIWEFVRFSLSELSVAAFISVSKSNAL